MSLCYALASGKGGVGKSTIAANLGACLAAGGSRVAIVDADIGLRSQDALLSLENRVVYDLIDVADGDCTLEQALLQSEAYPSLFLLPAAQFSRAKQLDPKKLGRIIRSLKFSFDYVLIDCPAGIERGLRNVLNAGTDMILLVVSPDDVSVRSAERAAQVIDSKEIARPLLIVNHLDSNLISSGEMMSARTVSEIMDLPLLGEIPEDPAVYRAALRHSLFISFDCEARRSVFRIAERLQGRNVPFPAYGSRRPSLFQRLRLKGLREVTPLDDH